MKKSFVLGLAALFVLTGCGGGKEKIPDAVDTLTKAVDEFNANDKTSLQMLGTFSSTYNDNTNTISLSALYEGDKAENQVNSILSMSYVDGTYMDYHFLTDNEHYIAYYQTGETGNKSADDSTGDSTAGQSEEGTESEVQASDVTSVYSLDEETFANSVAFGNVEVPFEEGDVKKVTTEKNEDTGATTWVFELKPKSSEKTATWLLEAINLIDTSSTDIDFKVNSLECSARYKEEGALSYLRYNLDVVMTAQGEDLAAKYTISYIPTGTGDEVTISLPDMEELEATAQAQEKAYNEYMASLEENNGDESTDGAAAQADAENAEDMQGDKDAVIAQDGTDAGNEVDAQSDTAAESETDTQNSTDAESETDAKQ